MKIAKKLLAAIVALMVVCSLTVTAFAAIQVSENAGAHIEADMESIAADGDELAVYVYLDNAIGATAWDFILTYDTSIFEYSYFEAGVDAEEVAETKTNLINQDLGDTNPGALELAGYFKSCLWTAADFAADAKNKKDADVNVEKTEVTVVYFNLIDAAKFDAETTAITLTGAVKFAGVSDSDKAEYAAAADAPVNSTVSHIVEPITTTTEAPSVPSTDPSVPSTDPSVPSTDPSVPSTDPSVPSTDPSVPSTDPSVPSTDPSVPTTNPLTPEDPSQPIGGGNGGQGGNGGHGGQGGPNHDHPNTGDSAVLAAAAGVVLLAGAAFVVTKKRK